MWCVGGQFSSVGIEKALVRKLHNKLLVQVNVKVKVKFTLEQATKFQRRSRSIAVLCFNIGARCGWVVNAIPRPHCTLEEIQYTLYRRASGPQEGLDVCGKFRPPPDSIM